MSQAAVPAQTAPFSIPSLTIHDWCGPSFLWISFFRHGEREGIDARNLSQPLEAAGSPAMTCIHVDVK